MSKKNEQKNYDDDDDDDIWLCSTPAAAVTPPPTATSPVVSVSVPKTKIVIKVPIEVTQFTTTIQIRS